MGEEQEQELRDYSVTVVVTYNVGVVAGSEDEAAEMAYENWSDGQVFDVSVYFVEAG